MLHWSKSKCSSLPRCTPHHGIATSLLVASSHRLLNQKYTGSSCTRCAGTEYNHNYQFTTGRMGNNDNLLPTNNPGRCQVIPTCSCASLSAATRTSGLDLDTTRSDTIGRGNLLVRAFPSLYQGVSLTSPREPLKRTVDTSNTTSGQTGQLQSFSSHAVYRRTSFLCPAPRDIRHVRLVYHGLYRSFSTVRPKSCAGENGSWVLFGIPKQNLRVTQHYPLTEPANPAHCSTRFDVSRDDICRGTCYCMTSARP